MSDSTSSAPIRDATTPGHAEVLARVRELATTGGNGHQPLAGDRADAVVDFAAVSIRRVPDDQIAAADAQQTALALVEAFRFMDERDLDHIAIRVFTPPVGFDGWSTPGSVVQIVADDRPFLLSTVTEELAHRDLDVVRTLHPIFGVTRDDDGRITAVLPARTADRRESLLHIELDAELDEADADALTADLRRLLRDAIVATRDYESMRQRVLDTVASIGDAATARYDDEEIAETAALLDWLLDDNFLLLGWREYEIVAATDGEMAGEDIVRVVSGSGLGILADEDRSHYAEPRRLQDMPLELRERFVEGPLLTVSRTNRLSTVHRRTRLDYIGVKRIGPDGTTTGEYRLLGLFTRKGYTEPARTTPVLRRKLQHILDLEDVVPGSHDEVTLVALFQALPKDELFGSDTADLRRTLVGLFHAEENRETRVLLRIERFTRTVSVLVAVPRDRYSPALREKLQSLLLERFDGEHVEVDLSLGDRADALVRFSVYTRGNDIPDVSTDELQREVRALARSWVDDVLAALVRMRGEAEGQRLSRQFVQRLPLGYRDLTRVEDAMHDIDELDQLVRSGQPLRVRLHRATAAAGSVRLKAFRAGTPLELSSFMPILESLGLTVIEEVPHALEGRGPELTVHDFGVRDARGGEIDLDALAGRLAGTTLAAWHGEIEVDSLNRLVLAADLPWQRIVVLRAYRRYLRQVGTAYTPEYINDALVSHPRVARGLSDLFVAMFVPGQVAGSDTVVTEEDREAEVTRLHEEVLAACDAVERLDHDRIMRSFLAVIDATLRTNAFTPSFTGEPGDGPGYLVLKLDSSAVPDMPKPVPYREIFVFSPEVEGIHLRGGPIARGGLRWSDRQDDVRTEVLGLMKAQMLKNAVIVPTGAKGGFVVKRPPEDPSELRKVVRRQYQTFVGALLDVTDNIVDGKVVPPEGVRRRDGDDAYLVVAADRGTATFSDTANAIAEEHDFWLGDAFASGGSRGYDHKALGITARGAWVAVQRHFRELGVDVQSEPVSVVGVGDMSGDVFGNAMLSSRTIRLVAAFDHRDIFLDPDPDAEACFEERQRLFDLPGSTWQNFDRDIISKGGGVFSRELKKIAISPELAEGLRIDDDELSPPELIRALLRAPVDLLFAGGIGTYVKGSSQVNADIGDRANDEIRIDADQLRSRAFGEGANLSITQAARVQYARRGGRINMDAIDNAAGVDISDHEVNVKILLGLAAERTGIDRDERDRLLESVTDDVVEHVLRDVHLQTWCVSQEAARSPDSLDAYQHVMELLEDEGSLDRAVELLPDADEMAARADAGAGLSRPELAVLIGYAKRFLAEDILTTDLPDQPATRPVLRDYFPALLSQKFDDLLPDHRLRRELVATVIANDLVNRMGTTFAYRLANETGASRGRIAAAYWAARQITGAATAWDALGRLDGMMDPERQMGLKSEVDALVAHATRTYLDDADLTDLDALIERDRGLVTELLGELMAIGTPRQRRRRIDRAQNLMDDLVEEDLATYLACAGDLGMAPDVAAVRRSLDTGNGARRPAAIADAFLKLGQSLAVDRLERVLSHASAEDRWARLQATGLADDLRALRHAAVEQALREEPDLPEPEAVERFLERRGEAVALVLAKARTIETADQVSLDAVAVAIRTLRYVLAKR